MFYYCVHVWGGFAHFVVAYMHQFTAAAQKEATHSTKVERSLPHNDSAALPEEKKGA